MADNSYSQLAESSIFTPKPPSDNYFMAAPKESMSDPKLASPTDHTYQRRSRSRPNRNASRGSRRAKSGTSTHSRRSLGVNQEDVKRAYEHAHLQEMVCVGDNTKNHHAMIGLLYVALHKKRRYCDVRIRIGQYEFLCHKMVLMAHSDYFQSLIGTKRHTGTLEISLNRTEVTPRSMEAIIEYMYEGQTCLNMHTVGGVIAACRKLGVRSLEKLAVDYLKDMVPNPATNTLVMLHICAVWNLMDLRDIAITSYQSQYGDITKSHEFLAFTADQLAETLCYDDVFLKDEATVFRAVMRWLNFHPHERTPEYRVAVNCIRFELLTTRQLLECMEDLNSNELADIPFNLFLKKFH